MTFTLRDPIMAKVDDRAAYLRDMLKEYPAFLRDWETKTMREFSKIASEYSDGDEEVKSSIYNSLSSAFDDVEDRKDMFYQSVFLMCFSYYESCVALLAKHSNAKELILAVCKSKNVTLSKDSIETIDYLQNDMNTLRNNICHNNFGTWRRVSVIEKIAKRNLGVDYSNDVLHFRDSRLINDTLDKMQMVLREVCEKLGYRNRRICGKE